MTTPNPSTNSANPPTVAIALVGHCTPDSYVLNNILRQVEPGLQGQRINSDAALAQAITQFDLFLVNRALDGEFSSETGIELIESLAKQSPHAVFLLISNFPEAQQAAVAAGALPGFGKSELGSSSTRQRLTAALAAAKSAHSTHKH